MLYIYTVINSNPPRPSATPPCSPRTHPSRLVARHPAGARRARCLPTGHAALSAELPDGGWPMGSLVELLSPHPGVGEIRLLRPALSQLETRRPIALVQPPHAPNIVTWMSWRLDPRQLLWVCPENRRTRSGPPSRSSGTAAAAPALLAAPGPSRIAAPAASGGPGQRPAVRRPASVRRRRPRHARPLRLALAPAPGGLSIHILKRRGLPAIRRCTWAWSPAPSKHPPAMRLWIAACLRCLPLDAIRPHWPDDAQAYAVLEQERVIALTPAARLAGVRMDMRRAGPPPSRPRSSCCRAVRRPRPTRCKAPRWPCCNTRPRSRWPTRPPCCWAWAPACNSSVARARRLVAATLRALDLRVSLGMAPTAAGAWLLAQRRERRACRRVLTLPTLVRRLDALPLALLPRRGRAWTGCRTSAAPRWATCAPCRAPACSGAARPNCWRRWTPPMVWRPSRNAGSSRRRASPAASS